MIPSLPNLADYDISRENGFLPSVLPLAVLPDAYYAPWENVARNLQPLILTKRLRGVVDALPVLRTDLLVTEPEWRRAYLILSIVAHAYIWGGQAALDRVPPPVSVPFLEICAHLELPPVATYAALVLWNFRPLFADEPVDSLSNLSTLTTFTGSLDESWFYLVSVAIEARAAPIIPLMLRAIEAARVGGVAGRTVVTECLRSFAERLDELGSLLQRMYEACDPHVFYHRIRPYIAGSKNMADAGLPHGVCFDTGSGRDDYVQFSGASAAQSSIIQFFDLVLGIEHRPTGSKPPEPTVASNSAHPAASTAPRADLHRGPSHNFILDMRQYMPGPHRRFLEHVARVANLRAFVDARRADRALVTAYDACLAMLRAFRDKHIQMVSRYIVVKSREARAHPDRSQSPPSNKPRHLADALPDIKGAGRRPPKGTGGTALIPFLKQARDETGEPAIDAWAQRLLNNGPAHPAFGERAARDAAWMTKLGEHASGEREVVGLAGTWSVDDSEGGICHW